MIHSNRSRKNINVHNNWLVLSLLWCVEKSPRKKTNICFLHRNSEIKHLISTSGAIPSQRTVAFNHFPMLFLFVFYQYFSKSITLYLRMHCFVTYKVVLVVNIPFFYQNILRSHTHTTYTY